MDHFEIVSEYKPTLIIANNKTLAGQLYGEFKEFFQITRWSILSPAKKLYYLSLLSRMDLDLEKLKNQKNWDKTSGDSKMYAL